MPRLLIRPIQDNDLDALLMLYAELHPQDAARPSAQHIKKTWASMQQTPQLLTLGGFLTEALVTTCQLVVIPNLTRACHPYALIENVVTTTAQRGQGHATALLHHARELAWQQGCYKVMLLTGRKDEATLHFYEAAGFDRHAKQAFYAAAPR